MPSAQSDYIHLSKTCGVLIRRQLKITHVDAVEKVAADDIQRQAANRRCCRRLNAGDSNSGDGVELVAISKDNSEQNCA